MFEINLSCSTFGKISPKEIVKPLAHLGVEPRKCQRLLYLLALHEFTLVEARQATLRLKELGRSAKLSMAPWIGSGKSRSGIFVHGGYFFFFAHVSTTNFSKGANGHDTERHARFRTLIFTT